MLHEELFFTVAVRFFYKKPTSLFLFVRDVLNQIRYTAIKIFTDSVEIFNVQTFGHFIVYVTYRRWSYSGLTGKLRLSYTLFTKYS